MSVEYMYNTNIPPQHVVKQYNNILNNIYYKNLIGITNKLLTLYTHTHTHTHKYTSYNIYIIFFKYETCCIINNK